MAAGEEESAIIQMCPYWENTNGGSTNGARMEYGWSKEYPNGAVGAVGAAMEQ